MKRVTKSTKRAKSIGIHAEAAIPADQCDLSVLTDTYGFLVRACQIQAFRGFFEAFGDTGLTPGSYATLALISTNPGIRQGFVASLLAFREPNMVRLVKELCQAGLITRTALAHDRRATGLELTEQGRQFMEGVQQRVNELERSYTADLTVAERDTLMALLKKLLRQKSHRDSDIEFHDH